MTRNFYETVILDCYTDEPSGYGVRPFLGTHQLHLSQALEYLRIPHHYLTIDDLRFCERGSLGDINNTDKTTRNVTTNSENALSIINSAKTIYIIMDVLLIMSIFQRFPQKGKRFLNT